MSKVATNPLDELSGRDRRALTQPMTVNYWNDPNVSDHQVAVYSAKWDAGEWVTDMYTVDPRAKLCDCPDMLHHRPTGGCKHVRRVLFELGERPIPRNLADELADGIKRTRDVIEQGASGSSHAGVNFRQMLP